MVLILNRHCVILSVLMPHGLSGWEVEELSAYGDGLGIGLVLLDFHDIIDRSLDIKWLDIFLKSTILYLCIA